MVTTWYGGIKPPLQQQLLMELLLRLIRLTKKLSLKNTIKTIIIKTDKNC